MIEVLNTLSPHDLAMVLSVATVSTAVGAVLIVNYALRALTTLFRGYPPSESTVSHEHWHEYSPKGETDADD